MKLKLVGVTCGLLLSTSSVYAVPAVPAPSCTILIGGSFLTTSTLGTSLGENILANNNNGLFPGSTAVPPWRTCHYTSLPSIIDTTCDLTVTESAVTYKAYINTTDATFCLFRYEVDLAAADKRTNGTVVTALASLTAVPIFTPLGILAMMSGLLWFGKRRRKFK